MLTEQDKLSNARWLSYYGGMQEAKSRRHHAYLRDLCLGYLSELRFLRDLYIKYEKPSTAIEEDNG